MRVFYFSPCVFPQPHPTHRAAALVKAMVVGKLSVEDGERKEKVSVRSGRKQNREPLRLWRKRGGVTALFGNLKPLPPHSPPTEARFTA